METIKFENKGKVKMIAHQGLSGFEVGNTLPSFLAAGVKSYYGIETDVHVTKDKKFIIHHDDDLKRIGIDDILEESTFEYLRTIRFKDTDNQTERNDLFLPELKEYLAICRKYDKQAILELKNTMAKQDVWRIVETCKQMGWYDRMTFISFSKENMLTIRERYKDASAQYLTDKVTDEELNFMIDNQLDADLYWECVTKEAVEKLHAHNRTVNCWTVDNVKDAAALHDMGVDQITTNILE